jgi:hypothetical protein
MRRSRILSSLLFLVLGASVNLRAQQGGYSFIGMPSSTQEIDLLSQDMGNYQARLDLQNITQGAEWDVNKNPYAYAQRINIRPWLLYHGIENVDLAFSTSYIRRFDIAAVDAKSSNEIRVTAMGTLTQPRSWGALYQQGRFEMRNIKNERATDWEHIPRLRFRFGQTFDLGQSRWKPRIPVYQEIILKHQEGDPALDTVRFFGGYDFAPAPRWSATLAFLLQYQLKSAKEFNVFFGPKFVVTHHFGRPSARRQPPPNL